jgi:hypothetical protein
VSIPSLCVELQLEGDALAYVLGCCSDEDERRLMLDVESRDLLGEIVDALVRLLDTLDDEGTS